MTNAAFHVMTRSEIPDIADSNIPDMADRKTRRRGTHAIAKRFAFLANAITTLFWLTSIFVKNQILHFLSINYSKMKLKRITLLGRNPFLILGFCTHFDCSSSYRKCSVRKGILKIYTKTPMLESLIFKKETPRHIFSFEFLRKF